MKSKSMMLILVSLGFGSVAAIGMVQLMAKNSPNQVVEDEVPVLVALLDLEHGAEITEENAKIDFRPSRFVATNAVSDLESVIGMKVTTRIATNQELTKDILVDPHKINTTIVPKGFKQYAITVDKESSLYGLLKPGDRIDLMASWKEEDETNPRVKLFLKNVIVAATNGETALVPGDQKEDRLIDTLQIYVTEKQAERIFYYQEIGNIRVMKSAETDGESKLVDGSGNDYLNSEPSKAGSALAGTFNSFLSGMKKSTAPSANKEETVKPVAPPVQEPSSVMIISTTGPNRKVVWSDRKKAPIEVLFSNDAAPGPNGQPGAAQPAQPSQPYNYQPNNPPASPSGYDLDNSDN